MANQNNGGSFFVARQFVEMTKSRTGKLKVVPQEIDVVKVAEGAAEVFAWWRN